MKRAELESMLEDFYDAREEAREARFKFQRVSAAKEANEIKERILKACCDD